LPLRCHLLRALLHGWRGCLVGHLALLLQYLLSSFRTSVLPLRYRLLHRCLGLYWVLYCILYCLILAWKPLVLPCLRYCPL